MATYPEIPEEYLNLYISGRMGWFYWVETWEKWKNNPTFSSEQQLHEDEVKSSELSTKKERKSRVFSWYKLLINQPYDMMPRLK